MGCIAAVVVCLALAPAWGQTSAHEPPEESGDSQAESSEPTESSEPPADEPPADDMPSLDELLGLEGADEGEDPADKDLERALSGQEVGDAFVQAVGLMGDVAERIEAKRDTGLTTQRLQEDILKRLDQLIASLEQMQQQSSSSSSSSRQQQQQQQQPNQPQPQDGQRQEGNESSENASAPELQEGQLRPGLEPVTAAWGNLPARVREMLMQGASDRFSAMYETMTEAYYKRLAEEGTAP